MFHEEQEGDEEREGYEERRPVQRQGKKARFASIPLRTHQPKAGQTVNTTRSYDGADPYTRGMGERQPLMKTRPAQAPVEKPQSFVSRCNMPALPDENEQYRLSGMPKSAIRFEDEQGNRVIRQGNRQLVIHQGKPAKQKGRLHWLFFLGLGMVVMVCLWVGGQWAIASIQQKSMDAQYGYPRTWQTDAVVGHNDSSQHPSHFIFENLNGHILVIEIPGGDPSRSIVYIGPTLFDPNADQLPVTGSFKDVNGDGRIDMLVSVNGRTMVYLNNGTKFVPQSQ